ncbi:protein stunted isoform X2 [Drosophila suzukii]|uniref:Protein stunted isoform X2 n=1 Tax=Drosophila suzukii TaxID=28584 RepID=A0AB39ZT76_DROSZ|nr:protein stunted isoform X2 [Drosophila suzukii]
MTAWRAAGITYIQYSNIAARVLRESLKGPLRADAAKRDASHVKFTPWANGKPAHERT